MSPMGRRPRFFFFSLPGERRRHRDYIVWPSPVIKVVLILFSLHVCLATRFSSSDAGSPAEKERLYTPEQMKYYYCQIVQKSASISPLSSIFPPTLLSLSFPHSRHSRRDLKITTLEMRPKWPQDTVPSTRRKNRNRCTQKSVGPPPQQNKLNRQENKNFFFKLPPNDFDE
jgi:hypothetical protein